VAVAIGRERAERLIGFRNSSGSLAMFAAIRRASSHVSSLAADRPPGCGRTRLAGCRPPPAAGVHRGLLHDEQVRRVCCAKTRPTDDHRPLGARSRIGRSTCSKARDASA
jgi:hypothetical protein